LNGDFDGVLDGIWFSSVKGKLVGIFVGENEGDFDVKTLGPSESALEGKNEDNLEGESLGHSEILMGKNEGDSESRLLGDLDSISVGGNEGNSVGI